MKKILISSIVAFALAAAPAYAAFTTYLTVGSTGADVSALQTWLIANNFDIPAITSGAAAKGYFGSQTKAAVVRYQASVGLPSTGFVGPLTIAKLNGTAGVAMTPVNCPLGYTCTANTVATVPPVCPLGYTCALNPGAVAPVVVTPGPVFVADGTDGSITLSTNSYVSSSQTLKKGDMDKPVLSMTAKAVNGNVQVNRFDIHFSLRPWLLFGRLTLKNAVTGQVLAVKTLSSAADVTEVTVGSDYLARFDNVNATVAPSADVTFVVTADVLSASDKITGQTVTISSDTNGIRTINGKGYTDTTGVVVSNSVVLSQTGAIGDLYTRVGLTTPDTRTDNISTTSVTPDEVLGVADIKLQNQSGTVTGINFKVNVSTTTNTSATTLLASNIFQNFRLYSGSTLLGGAYSVSAANPSVITFVNLSIPLTQDAWKSLTLKADALASSTAISASSTLVASSVTGVDSNYNTITLTNASDRTSNNVTLVPNAGITITAITPVKGSVTTPTTGVWLAAYPSISFTVNNTGSNPIYISKTSNTALATTTSSGANASSTVTSVVASGSTSGDTSTSYIINGSRTFTFNFFVDNTNGGGTSKKLSITQINYGTAGGSGTDNTLNVSYGLENAYVQVP